MEINEAVSSLMYIIFFAGFLTIVFAQNIWFNTTVTGLDVVGDFEIDLANEFIQSPCFIAKDAQGLTRLNTLDADALDDATNAITITNRDSVTYDTNHAELLDKICLDTKEYYYYIEIYDSGEPTPQWIFGNSSELYYVFPEGWFGETRTALIKKGKITTPAIIKYGFGTRKPVKYEGVLSDNQYTSYPMLGH